MHHGFEDSPDDYDMDMDARTRMLGRGGRIILLGDGTEILTGHGDHDGDIDMDDRIVDAEDDSSEEKDEEQLRRDQAKPNGAEAGSRGQREETPAPAANATPEDPKTTQAADKPNEETYADKAAK